MSITRIPIEIIELEKNSFHLFMKAEFGNTVFGNLIIDTGASKTIFDREFIQPYIIDYQKNEEMITSSGINNEINDIEFVIINKLSFQELIIENLPTAIMDLSHINNLYQKFGNKHIAGLIGSDFLVKYNALISYKEKHLVLEY